MAYDCRWQQVTCKRCKRTYQCTPDEDYYAPDRQPTGPDDGVCLPCLVATTMGAENVTVITITDAP